MATEHGGGFFADSHSWVLLATLAFIGIVYKFGGQKIAALLDARTATIKAELEEAERLRVEAQELLAQYQRKHRDAMKTADEIINRARESAQRIQEDAKLELEKDIERRSAQLLEKIARAEDAAVKEVRNQAADLAIRATEQLVTNALQSGDTSLIDQTISDLPKTAKA